MLAAETCLIPEEMYSNLQIVLLFTWNRYAGNKQSEAGGIKGQATSRSRFGAGPRS
jgi:hypothetical protein